MPWRVTKCWPGTGIWQTATKELFDTKEQADEKIKELIPLFPGRRFLAVEDKSEASRQKAK